MRRTRLFWLPMKTNTTVYRTLFGMGCLVLASLPALAGSDLATEGARVNFQPDEPTIEDAVSADNWFLSGWEGSFEFGLTGASGNNSRFNLRAAASASRENETSADTISLIYSYAKDESTQTENRFEANARHDWKFRDSPWRLYLGGRYEFDEFQDWDHRLTVGPGIGYQAIDNERTDLLLRAGIVATREFGGADDSWTPEANLGFDLAHQLTERQSLTASVDFYPALDEIGPYRFFSNAAWTIDIDPEANLFLKIGIEDRYDSNPGPDKKRNDITYFATVGWSF